MDPQGSGVEVDVGSGEPGELAPAQASVGGAQHEGLPSGTDRSGQVVDPFGGGDAHLVVVFGAGSLHGARGVLDEPGVDRAVERSFEDAVGLGEGVGARLRGVEVGEPPLDVDRGDLADGGSPEGRGDVAAQQVPVEVDGGLGELGFPCRHPLVFRPLAGPLSERWWERINRFRGGEHGDLQVEDS